MAKFACTLLRRSTTAALLTAAMAAVCFSANAQDKKKHEEAKPVPSYYGPQPATETLDLGMYQRIREEGFQHGKVMDFAEALNDGIGPRLTGSPNMAKANAWTRDTLTAIGLSNAHLEDWGEFGFGWLQVNTWARMVSPDPEPLWMQSAPWSPATKGPVSGEIVYVPLADAKELDALKGKLAGKIVLLGATRPTPDITKPLFTRYTDEDLKEMQSYEAGGSLSLSSPAFRARYAQRLQQAALRKQALAMMVDEEQLRADHFYRLKVFPVFAPSLRDRVSDIPVLVRHFVATHSRRMGKVIKTIPETAMAAPTRWTWPGNIRELENFLERAVILSPGSVLYIPRGELAIKDEDQGAEENISTLATAERDLILQTMRQTKGHISGENGAAARLGVKRTTLNSKLRKFDILRKDYM